MKASSHAPAAHLAWVLVALLVLAGLSLCLRFAHLAALGMPVALGIALLKALLILFFFMEILHERATVRLAFAAAVSLLALMLLLIVADVLTRSRPPLHPPGAAARYQG